MSKKLRAPKGTDEANFGENLYRVDNDGTVEVPDEAVDDLMKVGGFVPFDGATAEVTPLSGGEVRMVHADPFASASWGGVAYGADEDGHVIVPSEAAPHLEAHGFRLIEG